MTSPVGVRKTVGLLISCAVSDIEVLPHRGQQELLSERRNCKEQSPHVKEVGIETPAPIQLKVFVVDLYH
jgi:hypothetical protein